MKKSVKDKKPLIPLQFWDILYPFLFYYVVTVIVMFCAKLIFGTGEEEYMLCQIVVGLVTLPVMYLAFYSPDGKVWGRQYLCASPQPPGEKGKLLAWILLITLCFGTGLNNLIVMSPLAAASAGYAEANENFFAGTMTLELIGSGILTPLLEELTYRGVLYGRLRRYFGIPAAVLVSAFLFALMHYNMVQFAYALFMGLVFAAFVERSGSVLGSMAAHMAINILAVLRTELGWLSGTSDGSAFAWIISILLLCGGLILLRSLLKPLKKIKNFREK